MITQARLKELLDYDPATGVFTWKVNKGSNARIGEIAGSRHCNGYIQMYLDGCNYLAHRLVWLYVHGVMPELLDHEDGNKLNNTISNLRIADNSQNSANSKRSLRNTSGFKGVSPHRNKWRAYIKKDQKYIHLGNFGTPQEAHAAYCEAAQRLFGSFARSA